MELSTVQQDFLQIMGDPENMTKNVLIEGQVGSGKTMLGIEAMRTKVAHYLSFYGLKAEEGQKGKEQIRVVIVIQKGGQALRKELEKELLEDVGKQVTLEILAQNLLEGDLKKIVVSRHNFARFKKTIIMIDECSGHTENYVLRYYKLKELDHSLKTEYIHCIQYLDFEVKSQNIEETVQMDQEKVSVTLLQRQRNSPPILEISEFLQAHVGRRRFISDIQIFDQLDHLFATPKWIEVKNVKVFVKYAEANLSGFKGDAMIIKDSRKEKLTEISDLCEKLEWKYCNQAEVRGSESSLVIVYDSSIYDYKSFTRAKRNLLIVTISAGKRCE